MEEESVLHEPYHSSLTHNTYPPTGNTTANHPSTARPIGLFADALLNIQPP